MAPPVNGLHHITAIAGAPQENLDFYAGILGMRLVKRSVNQDDPSTYHLFYADAIGHPGSDLTFFPWMLAAQPRMGHGLAVEVGLEIPPGSANFWAARLERYGVTCAGERRFGDRALTFVDPHGRVLGLQPFGQDGDWRRFGSPGGAGVIDVRETPNERRGAWGIGAVHHLAWRVEDDVHQQAVRSEVAAVGARPTGVIDRFWFRSVYFREPGGVLFELATDGPGFGVDEDVAHLGEALVLPPFLEAQRPGIEAQLPELVMPHASESGR
jgi:glyoxalase family protein